MTLADLRSRRSPAPARVKIIGAGSIGNHLAQACRRLGWSVTVCDIDREALRRMRDDIYPSRYGAWDEDIELSLNEDASQGHFDAIFIGTPPDSHVPLALDALEERPRVLLIEKPLCPPTLDLLDELARRKESGETTILVGYNHVVGLAARRVGSLLKEGAIGEVQTMDVDFREHWGGIFRAHPWLDGPKDSYLGFWERGGGAGGEHSHGLNLWQHFARVAGAGRVTEVTASIEYVDGYDSICATNLRTDGGLLGRVVQDVVTLPPRKAAAIQGSEGRITWVCGVEGTNDAVVVESAAGSIEREIFEKTRPDDFFEEVRAVDDILSGDSSSSSLSFELAAETALVLHAAHRSEEEKATMVIDYELGFAPAAVGPASKVLS